VSLEDFEEVGDFVKAMARPTISIQEDGERIPYTKEDVKEGFKKWKQGEDINITVWTPPRPLQIMDSR
jgi:hypothetical protein